MRLRKIAVLFTLTISLVNCSTGRLSKAEQIHYSEKKSKALTEQAMSAFNRGKYKRAIDFYDIILNSKISTKKEKVWALYEKGFCYYYDKKFIKAKVIFQKLLTTYTEKEFTAQRLLAAKLIKKIDNRDTESI